MFNHVGVMIMIKVMAKVSTATKGMGGDTMELPRKKA